MVDEVRQIEGKVLEISRLQEIFTENVLSQENYTPFCYQRCCNSFSFRAFPLSQFFLNQRFFPMGIVGRIP